MVKRILDTSEILYRILQLYFDQMMLKSRPQGVGQKVVTPEFIQRNPIECTPFYPPNHIESDDDASIEINNAQIKPRRQRKKIFNRGKNFSETTFQQLNSQATKKKQAGFSIENIITNSSNKNSQDDRNSPSFYSMKNHVPVPPQHLSPIGKRKINTSAVNSHLQNLQIKIKQHENEIQNLNEKFYEKCIEDYKLQKILVGKLENNQKSLFRKEQELEQYLSKITSLEKNSNLQTQKMHLYELEIKRAKRLQELSSQNEKLYQNLIKSRENSRLTTQPYEHAKDQHLSSIVELQPVRDESMDNNTIGELLSPLLVNPSHL